MIKIWIWDIAKDLAEIKEWKKKMLGIIALNSQLLADIWRMDWVCLLVSEKREEKLNAQTKKAIVAIEEFAEIEWNIRELVTLIYEDDLK
jgi:hypothetical protein